MSIFNFFRQAPRKSVAEEAKERLQIVLAHERAAGSSPDYLPILQRELLAVIAKYVQIDEKKVEVSFERGAGGFAAAFLRKPSDSPAASAIAARSASSSRSASRAFKSAGSGARGAFSTTRA